MYTCLKNLKKYTYVAAQQNVAYTLQKPQIVKFGEQLTQGKYYVWI